MLGLFIEGIVGPSNDSERIHLVISNQEKHLAINMKLVK